MTTDELLEADTTAACKALQSALGTCATTTILLALAAEHDDCDSDGAQLLREFAIKFAAHEVTVF